MNAKDRFYETMRFGSPDRPPYREMQCWPETTDRWYCEGYPKHADYRVYFGFDRYENVGLEMDILPVFREEILEETDDHIIKNDWRGVKVKLSKDSRSIPFFYGFQVKDRESFRDFKRKLDPFSERRYPMAWDLRMSELKNRDYPVYIGGGRTLGFFGPIREWIGAETLLMGMYDDPAWIQEMIDYYADFIIETTRPLLEKITPDCVHFFEDMAYRGGSLISPAFFRKFMAEPYKKVIKHFRKYEIPFLMVDCDGNAEELIPLFIDLGINGMYPFEVQAGMDVKKTRQKFGKDFVIWGGIDKRVLERDKKSIDREVLEKLPEMLETGGYIPTLDHEPQPGIPFENFCYYRNLVRQICEKS